MHKRVVGFLVILGTVFVHGAAAQPTEISTPREIDDIVARLMRRAAVPGAGVGVIQNGKVIIARGYGFRDIEGNLRADAETLFPISSMTKSFTAAAIATLVDEGKLNWDGRLRTYLPSFKLQDPVASEHITLRDVLTHRSGLPRHEVINLYVSSTREQLVDRMAHLSPSKPFRAGFQYNNMGYNVAGYISGLVARSEWEHLIRERLFRPLGLNKTALGITEMLAVPNHAKGYGGPAERPREMSERDYTSFGGGPSGGVVSNVSDMLRYLDFQLNGGRTADGTQLISGRQMHEMHSAQVIAAEYDGVPEIHTVSYGFGWYRQSYRGHVMLHHGGTGPGTTSWMVLLPERNIGIVVLSNRDLTPFPWALSYEIADLLLGLEARDWMARITTWNANRQKQSGPSTPRRQNGTAPSHLLEAYTGAYVHEGYGRFEIGIHNGLLQLITPVRVPLEHYHYDVYRMSTDLPLLQGRLLQFHSDVSGSITSISVRLEPAAEPVLFTRMD